MPPSSTPSMVTTGGIASSKPASGESLPPTAFDRRSRNTTTKV